MNLDRVAHIGIFDCGATSFLTSNFSYTEPNYAFITTNYILVSKHSENELNPTS